MTFDPNKNTFFIHAQSIGEGEALNEGEKQRNEVQQKLYQERMQREHERQEVRAWLTYQAAKMNRTGMIPEDLEKWVLLPEGETLDVVPALPNYQKSEVLSEYVRYLNQQRDSGKPEIQNLIDWILNAAPGLIMCSKEQLIRVLDVKNNPDEWRQSIIPELQTGEIKEKREAQTFMEDLMKWLKQKRSWTSQDAYCADQWVTHFNDRYRGISDQKNKEVKASLLTTFKAARGWEVASDYFKIKEIAGMIHRQILQQFQDNRGNYGGALQEKKEQGAQRLSEAVELLSVENRKAWLKSDFWCNHVRLDQLEEQTRCALLLAKKELQQPLSLKGQSILTEQHSSYGNVMFEGVREELNWENAVIANKGVVPKALFDNDLTHSVFFEVRPQSVWGSNGMVALTIESQFEKMSGVQKEISMVLAQNIEGAVLANRWSECKETMKEEIEKEWRSAQEKKEPAPKRWLNAANLEKAIMQTKNSLAARTHLCAPTSRPQEVFGMVNLPVHNGVGLKSSVALNHLDRSYRGQEEPKGGIEAVVANAAGELDGLRVNNEDPKGVMSSWKALLESMQQSQEVMGEIVELLDLNTPTRQAIEQWHQKALSKTFRGFVKNVLERSEFFGAVIVLFQELPALIATAPDSWQEWMLKDVVSQFKFLRYSPPEEWARKAPNVAFKDNSSRYWEGLLSVWEKTHMELTLDKVEQRSDGETVSRGRKVRL